MAHSAGAVKQPVFSESSLAVYFAKEVNLALSPQGRFCLLFSASAARDKEHPVHWLVCKDTLEGNLLSFKSLAGCVLLLEDFKE